MREERLPRGQLRQAKHDLLHEETQVRRENRPGLLHRHTMTLLLQSASLNPTFNILRVTRIEVATSTSGIEDGAKHTHVGVDSPRSQSTRTCTIEHPAPAEMGTRQGMHRSTAIPLTMKEEADDVQRGGRQQGGGGGQR